MAIEHMRQKGEPIPKGTNSLGGRTSVKLTFPKSQFFNESTVVMSIRESPSQNTNSLGKIERTFTFKPHFLGETLQCGTHNIYLIIMS